MGLLELLIGVVFALAFGTGVAMTTSADTAAEFMFARVCYVVAAVALVAAYLWWLYEADRGPLPRLAVGILAALISLVGIPEAIRWTGVRESAFYVKQNQIVFPKNPIPEVSREQYELLKDVAAFVSGNEEKLNGQFDYGNMIHFNILMWRKKLFPETSDDELKSLIPTLGGPYTFNQKYMTLTQGRGGTFHVGKQDALYYIVHSPKYEAAEKKIDEFASSVLLPDTVKDALVNFKAAANWNLDDLMFEVLNTKFKQNPQNFILDGDIHSTDHGNISHTYNHQRKPLKPDAEKVTAAIRTFLHIR